MKSPGQSGSVINDAQCVLFLQWALPRMGLRWAGYRHVRKQVCKRLRRRMNQLGMSDVLAYRALLESDQAEWAVLDRLCIVTISRFYRDRRVWDAVRDQVLPAAARAAAAAGETELRCWSLGCASGEEPYTLSMVWALALADTFPGLRCRILATDVDDHVLRRARAATYAPGTLRELPVDWRERAFLPLEDGYALREAFRAPVELRHEDVRSGLPDETFRLILCRNIAFTYFGEAQQHRTLANILSRLSDGGALVIGRHERPLAALSSVLQPWMPELGIFRAKTGTHT